LTINSVFSIYSLKIWNFLSLIYSKFYWLLKACFKNASNMFNTSA